MFIFQKTKISRAFLLVLLLTLILSCAQEYRSFAVLLWSEDEVTLENGSIFGILGKSDVRKEFQVHKVSDLNQSETVIMNMPFWRVQVFASLKEAQTFTNDRKALWSAWARSNRQALPIRQAAQRDSPMVYRLRTDEKVKVVSRAVLPSSEADLFGYWYEVLADGGTKGWVFDYELEVSGEANGGIAKVSQDPLLDLFAGNWRPDSYLGMIKDDKFDFDEFNPEYGAFFDQENKRFRLRLSDENVDIKYNRFDSRGRRSFFIANTGVQITVNSADEIIIEWFRSKEKTLRVMKFTNFTANIKEIYEKERLRREQLIARLRGNGLLTSQAYGSLALKANGSFVWQGFEVLAPSLIPSSADGTGSARIKYYLGDEIKALYQGVLSFNFNYAGGIEEVNFLFQIHGNGVRLEPVSRANIKDQIVTRTSTDALIIFFNY